MLQGRAHLTNQVPVSEKTLARLSPFLSLGMTLLILTSASQRDCFPLVGLLWVGPKWKAIGHSFGGQQKAGQSIDQSIEGGHGRDSKDLGTLGWSQLRLESHWEEVYGREGWPQTYMETSGRL